MSHWIVPSGDPGLMNTPGAVLVHSPPLRAPRKTRTTALGTTVRGDVGQSPLDELSSAPVSPLESDFTGAGSIRRHTAFSTSASAARLLTNTMPMLAEPRHTNTTAWLDAFLQRRNTCSRFLLNTTISSK